MRSLPIAEARVRGGTRGQLSSWGKEMREAVLDSNERLPGYGRGGDDQYSAKEGWKRGMDEERSPLEDGLRRLRVLGQCKAERKPLSTRYVREMEGVMAHFHGTSALFSFLDLRNPSSV